MKKKQILIIALVVSAIASVGVYRLIRQKMIAEGGNVENDAQDEEYETDWSQQDEA